MKIFYNHDLFDIRIFTKNYCFTNLFIKIYFYNILKNIKKKKNIKKIITLIIYILIKFYFVIFFFKKKITLN